MNEPLVGNQKDQNEESKEEPHTPDFKDSSESMNEPLVGNQKDQNKESKEEEPELTIINHSSPHKTVE